MPPQLALLICTVFVLFLLRLDRKQAPMVSSTLWLPSIWLLSAVCKPLAYWFGVSGGSIEAGSPLDRALQTCLLCAGLFMLARRPLDWPRVRRANMAAILLLGYMFVSLLWSDIMFIAFKRWIRDFVVIVLAFLLLTEHDPRLAMECLLRRLTYILIPFSLLLVKYFPHSGVWFSRWTGEIQWVGVTMQKNGLGLLCLVAASFLLWTLYGRWKGTNVAVARYQTRAELLLLAMTLWLLKGPSLWAASVSSIASLCVGIAVFAALSWMKAREMDWGRLIWAPLLLCIMSLGIILPLAGGEILGSVTSAVGRDASLTGRTDIWAGLLPDFIRSPVWGYGFGSFWTSKRIALHEIGEAHNGYLELGLTLGGVGLLLMFAFLMSFCRNATRALSHHHEWAGYCLSYLLFFAVNNIVEAAMDDFSRFPMAILLFLSVTLPAETELS